MPRNYEARMDARPARRVENVTFSLRRRLSLLLSFAAERK